jgi:hypothetical protein
MVTTTRRAPAAFARCAAPGPARGGPARRCTGCGCTASAELRQIDRRRPNLPDAQRWLAAGDLDVAWLIPSGRSFTEARFCRACAPAGSVIDIECKRCGDGPPVLLGMSVDERAPDRVVAYLRRTGWQGDVGRVTCLSVAYAGPVPHGPKATGSLSAVRLAGWRFVRGPCAGLCGRPS